jgi:hypothetical protein
VANVKDWDDSELGLRYMAAMREESDRVIVIPGQEKPLFASTEAGSVLLQFKSFMFASTVRTTASILQGADKHLIQGGVSMMGLGMLSYYLKMQTAGKEVSDDPAVWIAEGIDRSGVLGILGEVNNAVEKTTGFGYRRLIGAENPHSSRYASRSVIDSWLGPSFGTAQDIFKAVGGTASVFANEDDTADGFSEAQQRAFVRLLPYNNHSVIRAGFQLIEDDAGGLD